MPSLGTVQRHRLEGSLTVCWTISATGAGELLITPLTSQRRPTTALIILMTKWAEVED